MIQKFGRRCFIKFNIYRYGMTMIRTDQRLIFVKGIPLFFIRRNDLLKHGHVKVLMLGYAFDKLVDFCPTVPVKSNSDRVGLVAKN